MRNATLAIALSALTLCACSTTRESQTAKVEPPVPACSPPAELMQAPPGLYPLPHQSVSPAVATELWYQDRVRYAAQTGEHAALQKWIRENCQPVSQTAATAAANPAAKAKQQVASLEVVNVVPIPTLTALFDVSPVSEDTVATAFQQNGSKPISSSAAAAPAPVAQVATSVEASTPASKGSLYVFECGPPVAPVKASVHAVAQPAVAIANAVQRALPIAVDKGWVKMLWEMEGEDAVKSLGRSLCQRQSGVRPTDGDRAAETPDRQAAE